jgi:hypothetical protein
VLALPRVTAEEGAAIGQPAHLSTLNRPLK